MYELLVRVETLLSPVSVVVLLGVGSLLLVVGLVLWLGGSRYSTVLVGLLGAVVGSVAGLLVSQWLDLHLWLCLVAGAAILATACVLLRNALILTLAVVVIAAVSGAGYLAVLLDRGSEKTGSGLYSSTKSVGLGPEGPSGAGSLKNRTNESLDARPGFEGEKSKREIFPPQSRPDPAFSDPSLETRTASGFRVQSFTNMDRQTRLNYLDQLATADKPAAEQTFRDRVRAVLDNTWQAVEPHAWKVGLAVLAGGAVAIFLVWLVKKALIALAYSVVGTATILLGLQTALLGAGFAAVSSIGPRPWALPGTFLGMTAVGWLWQLAMCRPKAERRTPQRHRAHGEEGKKGTGEDGETG